MVQDEKCFAVLLVAVRILFSLIQINVAVIRQLGVRKL